MTDNDPQFTAELDAFRQQHEAVLNDKTHPAHEKTMEDYTAMFQGQFGPVDAETAIDKAAREELGGRPDYEEAFTELKLNGLPVGHEEPWNKQLESDARTLFRVAELNGPEAKAATLEFANYLKGEQRGETYLVQASNEALLMDDLAREHGKSLDAKLNGARRVVAELDAKVGGRLTDFLETTKLGSNRRYVQHFVKLAEKRGYC